MLGLYCKCCGFPEYVQDLLLNWNVDQTLKVGTSHYQNCWSPVFVKVCMWKELMPTLYYQYPDDRYHYVFTLLLPGFYVSCYLFPTYLIVPLSSPIAGHGCHHLSLIALRHSYFVFCSSGTLCAYWSVKCSMPLKCQVLNLKQRPPGSFSSPRNHCT